jgi:hypothetical protein
MSSHNTIVVNADARGRFIEGSLTAGTTPKPGTLIKLDAAGTYSPGVGAADGAVGEVIVLVEDALLGRTKSDAYASGARFRAYIPCPGDEIQVLALSGEDIDVAEECIIDSATGKVIATTGTPEMTPFIALEDNGVLAADTLTLVRCTGH